MSSSYNLRPRTGVKSTPDLIAELERQRMEEEQEQKAAEQKRARRSPDADEHGVMAFFSTMTFSDPCASLGAGPFHAILACLGPADLAACTAVSRAWHEQAQEERLWAKHAQELWRTKAYVPAHIRAQPSKRRAYAMTLEDGSRTAITEDELVTFTWSFHFKEDAGAWWTTLASERYPLHRYFHRDHSVTGDRDDPLSHFGDPAPTWQFRKTKEGRRGTFVQVNRYPSLEPSRLPDGRWRMQNIWVVMTSDVAAGANPGKGKEPLYQRRAGDRFDEEHGDALDLQWFMVVEALAEVFTAQAAQQAAAAGNGGVAQGAGAAAASSSSSSDDGDGSSDDDY